MNAIGTVLQLRVADAFRARVLGVWGLSWSLAPLGATLAGAIAVYADARVAVAAGGAVVVAMSLWMFVLMPGLRRLDRSL